MYFSSIIYFFHFLPFLRMEALYHMMTFFDATDCTNSTFSQLLCPELEEEVIRRHVLWRNGCELRSVLTDSGDFLTIMASASSCESFSGGRYVLVLCEYVHQLATLVLFCVFPYIWHIDVFIHFLQTMQLSEIIYLLVLIF